MASQTPAAAAAAAAATPNMSTPVPAGTTAPHGASGSLYVGDLQNDVTEALLFEVFNQVGPVSSIRVCRDAASRRSLGYAYVNFHSGVDAERALDTLNFTAIKGRPCRIMWSQRNPAVRKNTHNNVFIKNLDKQIDNKQLYDTFSAFGNILSSKIATDPTGSSKGYGFVHYDSEDGAQKAIENVNGMLLSGKKVFVSRFVRRSERAGAAETFTNVYVKFLPADWDQDKLRKEFARFGEITSAALQMDETGKSKCVGFVNFGSHEEAMKAVDGGKDIPVPEEEGKEVRQLYVARFQSRAERTAMITKMREEKRKERSEKYRNLNLYVKNLEEGVSEEKLKEWFTQFGEITSVAIMKDEKSVSRGFGFVCFASEEAATKALGDMNGKVIENSKPLYVNRAQRKEERKLLLDTQFQASLGQRMAMAPMFYAPNMAAMPQSMVFPPQMVNRRYTPQPVRNFPMYPMKGRGRGGQGRGGMAGHGRGGQHKPRGAGGYGNVRAQHPQHHQHPQQPQPVQVMAAAQMAPAQPAQELSALLANSSPEQQKQILGERLFPLISKEQGERAGKITGMLLEMDVSDVLNLLENEQERASKIQEAVDVLDSHASGQ